VNCDLLNICYDLLAEEKFRTNRIIIMRTVRSAFFGFALALSTLAMASQPASALENPAAAPAVSSPVIKAATYCSRWCTICAHRWPALGWRFHRCVNIHGCFGHCL
jgi:hypothetical protein